MQPLTAESFAHRLADAGFDALQRAGARIRIYDALQEAGGNPTDAQLDAIIEAAIRAEADGQPLPGRPLPTGFDEPARA